MTAPVQQLTPRSAIAVTKSDTTVYDKNKNNMGPLSGAVRRGSEVEPFEP